ncbi:lanthionine synthetase C family protein [Streptomyces sp. NA02950]|uniref:lanthionine synthetase C family protein n=1 Tax=Streptomyces sp. NA02950 TaxID=2742137 RepID=UPI001592049F|nr:lanthionine synthetase C family protein [Streptomyces sp. NA02950]QKV95937.1 lanthionine synthetase C family protein [Streptomyces sp. NA02950]
MRPIPQALAAADTIVAALTDPHTAWAAASSGRAWPQSLAGGAAGIALLHIERAHTGHGDWITAHTWISRAASEDLTAASNASLYLGAPALAFVLHAAAGSTGRYRNALEKLNEATIAVTRRRLAHAHARIGRGERPAMQEFDLIRGLAGLGAYHLVRQPHHEITADVLAYLVRLTDPLPEEGDLPPWWTDVSPSGESNPAFPGGHGNFGLAHGIGSVLALLSLALLRGLPVPGAPEAIRRICAWTDQWRQQDDTGPWWPGLISIEQATGGHIDPALRPRPSWCYGVSGTARAHQLAGLALGEPTRVQAAENAILAALRDPIQLELLPEIGLCHGTAGLLHAAWRMADQTRNPAITAELPHLADRLIVALGRPDHDPELLDGAAGAALALHTIGTGIAPASHWDTFLALA